MFNTKLLTVLVLTLSLFSVSCDHIVTATIEDPELCKVFRDMEFPGAGIFGGIKTTVNTSFVLDVGSDLPTLNDEHMTSNIKLLYMALIPKAGLTDMSFIEKLKLNVASGKEGSTLPEVNVIDFDRTQLETGDAGDPIDLSGGIDYCPAVPAGGSGATGASGASGASGEVVDNYESCVPEGSAVYSATSEPNLSPYIDENLVDFRVSITAPLPANDWKVDVKMCFYLEAKYEK